MKKRTEIVQVVLVAVLAFTAVFSSRLLQTQHPPKSAKAVGEAANFYFQPASATMPPNLTSTLWVDAKSNKLGAIKVDVLFDPAKIQLAAEVAPNQSFKKVISVTSMVTANTTGRISIRLGTSPADMANPPTGNLAVATFVWKTVTTTANDKSSVSVNISGAKVVDLTPQDVLSSATTLDLTLNPGSTPTINTLNLYPEADTYLNSSSVSRNYGTSQTLLVDGSPVIIGLMRFDLNALSGKTVTSAALKFKVSNSSTSIQNIKRVSNTTWSETGTTYSNRPALGTLITSFPGGTAGSWKSVDITEAVREKLGQKLSIGIDSSGSDGLDFYSKEYTSAKPYLVVQYYP